MPKRKYDYENRGGGQIGGEKPTEGRAKMNEAIRLVRSGRANVKKTGGLSLSDPSPGDVLRANRKMQQLERLEQQRKSRGG